MRLFHGLAACLATVAIAVSGCAVVGSQATPVNNDLESIRHCNRPVGKGVLLTFDDHGSARQIQAILDKLREHQMRAAFFPTGKWAEQHLDLIGQIKAAGHIVGNHTYSHANLAELSAHDEAAFYGEIYPLRGVPNTNPMLLRLPFGEGENDPLVWQRLTEKNVQACTWTTDTRDWEGRTVEQMMDLLMHGAAYSEPLGPDSVVLAHMHGQHTPELIDAIVRYLNEKGWKYERTA